MCSQTTDHNIVAFVRCILKHVRTNLFFFFFWFSISPQMEACQGAEPVSTSMADNCPGEAMASVPGPKVEPSEAVKAGATSSTGCASGVKPLNSGRTVSESQNVTNDSADSSRRPTPQFIEGLERCFMHLCEVFQPSALCVNLRSFTAKSAVLSGI